MTGGQMMVVLIVAMVMIATVLKARYGHAHRRRDPQIEGAESARLREEVVKLRDRVAVLERIATDKNHLLEEEFERLRER